MKLNTNLKNIFLVVFATLILSACSTAKKSGNIDGDVYTGKETVKYLASGVPDRVFFATNKSSLTTASRATLRKQAKFLRKNKKLLTHLHLISKLNLQLLCSHMSWPDLMEK